MRLSESILLGSIVSTAKAFFYDDFEGGRCAFGMALVANSRPALSKISAECDLYFSWPWLRELAPSPCGCSTKVTHAGNILPINDNRSLIAHIFNEHVMLDKSWSMERLVDYVRSIEPTDSPESVTNPQETSTEKVTV